MTLTGTNSYVVDCGRGEALVIDPGPVDDRHVDDLLAAAASRNLRISTIALTHGHPDHAPGAVALAARTGARVLAHPHSEAQHDGDLPLEGELTVGDLALRVIDAPGHTFEHVIFYEPSEAALYRLLQERLPGTTMISIGHRSTLEAFQRELESIARVM